MEVIDPFVLKPLSTQIVNWLDALNRQDISAWNARQVAEFLKNLNEDLVFSDYARKHIDRMIDRGQERNAKNYQLALQHMERYFGTTSKVRAAHLDKRKQVGRHSERHRESQRDVPDLHPSDFPVRPLMN